MRRQILFISLTVFLSLLSLVLLDVSFSLCGINDEYRRSHPDKMHREDLYLFFIERSNMTLDVPIFNQLSFSKKPGKPLYYWHVKTNSKGMNYPEFTEKKKNDELRIVALGDSCTFGWGLDRKDTYVSQTEQVLQKRFPDRNIVYINAGHTGYTSFQGTVLFHRYIRYWSPDIITISFGLNDHKIHGHPLPDSQRYTHNMKLHNKLIYYAKQRSEIFLLLFRMLKGKASHEKSEGKTSKHINRVSEKEFSQNLTKFIIYAKETGSQIVFLIEPHALWTESDERYYQEYLRVIQENNSPSIDFATIFREYNKVRKIEGKKPELLFIDSIHPTKRGSEIITEYLSEKIGELIE